MAAAAGSQSILGQYLALFSSTEIFIFVFMEIAVKIDTIQRVIFRKANLRDYAGFTLLFGLFSIFGTYIGITENTGAIVNIRDLAPMVAGLVAGPWVGLAVGLIGGIHRFFLGGVSCVPCSLATVLAGVLGGAVYVLNKERLLGIIPSMIFAAGIELLHGGLALLLIQPYSLAVEIVATAIPQMVIANSLGMGIAIIIVHDLVHHYGDAHTA
ncbi:MAG TPA: LytS/YhcK type 5TM receptor domain-containing protein [Methanomicrobiales archaeon]|jgi:sigma-B regulation protein RsbU (phosphoserine phosphatase)|nr:LytS/YhcK type 5TM receptor domain-containing protein [Methanomicrobiales archaeon]